MALPWQWTRSFLFSLTAFAAPCLQAADVGISAEESLKTFKVAEGLEATVWAAEPHLVNPTNMDIDERGRIWITEGANYRGYHGAQKGPTDIKDIRPEGDRVVILEDTDGDGKCDSSKVFVQDKNLYSPLGIGVIGNKVYVSQSPKLLVYTIDASGDKPVGPPEVLFQGFSGVNHDHGLHAVLFGPDGRLYFNSGNSGLTGENFSHTLDGSDRSGYILDGKGKPVVDSTGSELGPKGKIFRGKPKEGIGYQDGMAFRCNPDGTEFESLGYNFRNNYEVTVDSFGTAWQSDNDDDGNQSVRISYIMEGGNHGFKGPTGSNWQRDKPRYPDQTTQEAHWHMRMPGVVPTLLITGGGSPTGITVYEGDLLPEQFRGALIHCDAGPNVVRAYPTTAAGAGFKAGSVEVIKATDKLFRPADVCTGPDGALYVADWYDSKVGGHGMNDNALPTLKGRVFRVAPPGFKATKPAIDLNTVAGQIAALQNPNFAVRHAAYSKLVAGGADAVTGLKALYKDSKNPRHRARALWLLARSPEGPTIVKEALKDADVDIRITALRAARLIKQDMVAIAKEMVADASPQVLRELCLAMNYEPTEKALPVIVALADKYDGEDRWYLEAVGIAATKREKEVLEAWQKDGKNKDAKVAEKMAWRMNKTIPELPPPAPAPAKDAPKPK